MMVKAIITMITNIIADWWLLMNIVCAESAKGPRTGGHKPSVASWSTSHSPQYTAPSRTLYSDKCFYITKALIRIAGTATAIADCIITGHRAVHTMPSLSTLTPTGFEV